MAINILASIFWGMVEENWGSFTGPSKSGIQFWGEWKEWKLDR